MAPRFGDVEAVAVMILRDSPVIQDFQPIVVSTDLIGYNSSDRWLQVSRTGGEPTLWQGFDNAIVRITSYAEDKGMALDIAVAAREAPFGARGYSGDGVELYDVDDDQGLTWLPDEQNPSNPRYQLSLVLVTRAVTT
jgi:hypothetical protein